MEGFTALGVAQIGCHVDNFRPDEEQCCEAYDDEVPRVPSFERPRQGETLCCKDESSTDCDNVGDEAGSIDQLGISASKKFSRRLLRI